MNLVAFAELVQQTWLGIAMRGASPAVVLAIQIGHVLGLVLLLSSLLLVNLRLLGWALRGLALAQVVGATRRVLWLGLGLTAASGSLLFLSAPVHYAGNTAFVPKMLLLFAALVVQATLYRRVTIGSAPSPLLARGSAALSLSLWFGVGFAGRAIGFV